MKKTHRESLDEFERDIEDEYYDGFKNNITIIKPLVGDGIRISETKSFNTHNTDGSKTNFYDVNGCKDVDDLCEHWGLSFAEGNCLKALVGIAKARGGEVRHDGTSAKRDAKKLVHYARRVDRVEDAKR